MSILTQSYRRLIASNLFPNQKSILFDGIDAHVRFSNSVFDSLGDGSISLWFKTSSLASAILLFNANINGAGNDIEFYVQTTGRLSIFARTSGVNRYFGQTAVNSIVTNTWYHVVWTKSGVNHNLYINGVDTAISYTISTNRDIYFNDIVGTRLYTLGAFRGSSTSFYLPGYMDEFVISPTAWTQNQVTELYNTGRPGDVSIHSDYANVITWLRMGDNDTYPTLLDQKGTNNATMTNMLSSDIANVIP